MSEIYKKNFQQESVLLATSEVKVSFYFFT
ncbi:MAG: hypothetical protein U7126_07810 [Microcoleus sp.]